MRFSVEYNYTPQETFDNVLRYFAASQLEGAIINII